MKTRLGSIVATTLVLLVFGGLGAAPQPSSAASGANSDAIAQSRSSSAAESKASSCRDLPGSDPHLELLPELCRFALTYRHQLPDFIAQQTTTVRGAKTSTVLTEQVVFRQGRESYSQLTINGKAFPGDAPARLPRNVRFTSAGEFGSLLVDLFTVPGATEFKLRRGAMLQGIPVVIYEFHVPQAKNSFWTIRDASQRTMKPEFRGEVWLDRAGHPLREELEPLHLPSDWSTNSIKTVTDYALTTVGDVGKFLLPVKSETTVCLGPNGFVRPTIDCTSNTLVFHDYQKFATSTRILDVQVP